MRGIESGCQFIYSTNVCWVPALCRGPGEARGPQSRTRLPALQATVPVGEAAEVEMSIVAAAGRPLRELETGRWGCMCVFLTKLELH